MEISWRSRLVPALVVLMVAFPLVGTASLRAAGTPDADTFTPANATATAAETAPSTETPTTAQPPEPLKTTQPTSTPGANASGPYLTVDGLGGPGYSMYEESDVTVEVSELAGGQEITIAWSESFCPNSVSTATRYGPFTADEYGRVVQQANLGHASHWSIQAQTSDGTWSNCVTIAVVPRPAPPTATPTGETDVRFDRYRYPLPASGSFTARLVVEGRGVISPRQMVISTDSWWNGLEGIAASAQSVGSMQCTLVEQDDIVVVQLASTGDGTCIIDSVWAAQGPHARILTQEGVLYATEWIDGQARQRDSSIIMHPSPSVGTPVSTNTPMATDIPAYAPEVSEDSTALPAINALPNTGVRVDRDRPMTPLVNGMSGATFWFWLLGAILFGGGAMLMRRTTRRGTRRHRSR